jgi:DNA primase
VSVVTLPQGEDPDTLVQRGGAEAFQALLAEAVDVFERKIQLVERKGLLRTLEGRREALDRLLPTIRAAQDPITRQLYIARAAERSGVAKEVLEQEVGRLDAQARGRDAQAGPGPRTPEPGTGRGEAAALRPADVPIERTLVHLLLSQRELVPRAREAVAGAEFRHQYYREIAEALYAGAAGPSSSEAQALWTELAAQPLVEQNPEDVLVACVSWMQDRRTQERRAEIDRLIDLAPADEKDKLVQEKRDLAAASEPRFGRKAFKAQREPRY